MTHSSCGNYAAATSQADELLALAEEKSAPLWKAFGSDIQGCAVGPERQSLGRSPHRSPPGSLHCDQREQHVAIAACAYHIWRKPMRTFGQFDDAWRCIGEAMTAVETTKETWCEAEVYRMAGEIALKSPRAGRGESGRVFRACARGRASAASKVLGTARGDEHGAALARSGEAAASSRTARSGLRLVHRRLRHARSEGGKGAAGRVGGITVH